MSLSPERTDQAKMRAVIARLKAVSLHYGKTVALDNVTLDIPANCMVGVIGPDGVGKSTLFSLISGAHRIQQGSIEVLGGNMADAQHRIAVCPRIAYMPQGLGKNLYPTLSVSENIDFFGSLFGQSKAERDARIEQLLKSTGLARFGNRPAGKLSGGMKQKVGLCCALIHDPDFLILDEPTTGVDPLSRRQFWELIDRIRAANPGMSVIVSTAYMEEAARFDWLVAMNAGRVLATGTPEEFLSRTGATDLDAAFIQMLPEEMRRDYKPVQIPPRAEAAAAEAAIEADGLTKRFGDFVAVDHVSFRITKGEIFGFLGSNGCGKTTTMKMMTGLLTPSEGTAKLFGQVLDPSDIEVRRHIGYMSQAFSLYTELTVRQNLDLHARLFGLPAEVILPRIDEVARRFGLETVMEAMPDALPLGIRQRLSLAVAMIHSPQILILDEPTSGVDPVARDEFWRVLLELSRRDNVTIFVSTHFMNEAERCDRISLMNAGKVLVSDTPKTIIASRQAATLEEAFIRYLEDAGAREGEPEPGSIVARVRDADKAPVTRLGEFFNLRRMLCLARREGIELLRDPVRMALALVGSVVLMFVVATGINLDVDNLTFAVLDRDQSVASQNYALNIFGSHYFIEKPPIADYDDLDRRMRSGDISLAIEIPPHFGRDVEAGRNVKIAAWIDGAMPERGETIRTYVQSIHLGWLNEWRRTHNSHLRDPFQIQLRYRYNPGVVSLVAITPAVIPLLLILIPSILSALSVVREKELGSIINFYVTPATPLEFLLGKQAPYIVLSMGSFLLLFLFAVLVLRVPFTGSFSTLALGALLYVAVATALGLFISSFITSQVAAIVGTAILTLIPAINYCGLTNPVSSIEGPAKLIGRIFPTTYFMIIARGTFSKGLALWALAPSFIPLVISVVLLLTASTMLLKKQAG